MTSSARQSTPKPPHQVLETVFAFPPNRDTLGGTAYLVREAAGNILIDCPAWEPATQTFLQQQGGVRWLFITHRGGLGKVRQIHAAFDCEVVIQEQEAYLLPGLAVTSFHTAHPLSSLSYGLWTPGHSPGSACLYYGEHGGVLFSGRHLLPNAQGQPTPLRVAKTFHWFRQLRSVQSLRDRFTPETLRYLCPGANVGFLRGQHIIDHAYDRLAQIDLDAQRAIAPML